jgi:hypothetical protein
VFSASMLRSTSERFFSGQITFLWNVSQMHHSDYGASKHLLNAAIFLRSYMEQRPTKHLGLSSEYSCFVYTVSLDLVLDVPEKCVRVWNTDSRGLCN